MIVILLLWIGVSIFCLRDLWRALNLSRLQKIIYSVLVPGTGMIGILLFFTFRSYLLLPPKQKRGESITGLAAVGAMETPPFSFQEAYGWVKDKSSLFLNLGEETLPWLRQLADIENMGNIHFQPYERGFYWGEVNGNKERHGTGLYIWNFDARKPYFQYEMLGGNWNRGLPQGTAVFFSQVGPSNHWFYEYRNYLPSGKYEFYGRRKVVSVAENSEK